MKMKYYERYVKKDNETFYHALDVEQQVLLYPFDNRRKCSTLYVDCDRKFVQYTGEDDIDIADINDSVEVTEERWRSEMALAMSVISQGVPTC